MKVEEVRVGIVDTTAAGSVVEESVLSELSTLRCFPTSRRVTILNLLQTEWSSIERDQDASSFASSAFTPIKQRLYAAAR